GWSPERWAVLETLRAALVLSRSDLEREGGARAIEEGFRYADEGELRALYRTLAHVPAPERFAWRAGEGCRSNMKSGFEAGALVRRRGVPAGGDQVPVRRCTALEVVGPRRPSLARARAHGARPRGRAPERAPARAARALAVPGDPRRRARAACARARARSG